MEERDSVSVEPDQNQKATIESATSLYWKVSLYELLAGTRATEIIQIRGSASDYVKALLRRSPERIVARHFLVEALNEILDQESLISWSAAALNHLLDLIVEFKPRNGFSAIVNYLRLGAKAESHFVPIGAAVAFDLHRKMLATLGAYFNAPAIEKSDPAFLTYVEILNQQLHSEYRGYAASVLLKLKVLQPNSPAFKAFIDRHPDSLNEIFVNLSHYATRGYGQADIQALFMCAWNSAREYLRSYSPQLKPRGGC